MKPTVYIESSVISYLTSRPSRDVVVAGRQAITSDWWENHRHRFDLRISLLVEEEISKGDQAAAQLRRGKIAGIASLAVSDEAVKLANLLLSEKAVPAGSEEDALHIGIAAAQGAEYLLRGISSISTTPKRKQLLSGWWNHATAPARNFARRKSLEEQQTMNDPIVEEIRRFRKEHAAQHGNDLNRIAAALREKERCFGNGVFESGAEAAGEKSRPENVQLS